MSPQKPTPGDEQPFVAHLIELRDRLLRIIIAVLLIFLVVFPFANELYTYLAQPLMGVLPEGSSMIATDVASPFLTPFKFALVLSVFAAVPVILHQLWAFIAPGLYHDERSLMMPLLISSVVLFYLGVAFAYFVVFPLVFGFFTKVAPTGVSVMTDISKYLDFVLKMFFAFGVAFEVPIATFILVWTGVTTPDSLSAKRPYVIVAAFVIGMLLTPPDIISQTLLAVPMWLLFEIGIFFSRSIYRKKEEKRLAEEQEDADEMEEEAAEEQGEHEMDEEEYRPMTEEEMDTELDNIESEEEKEDKDNGPQGTEPTDKSK
jgi:sec-independent protein translocase protein TatC